MLIRTVVALIAKIPEHKIHVISPDIGGRLWQQGRRLSRLHLRRGGLHRHRQAREMGRGSHRET